MNCIYLKTAKAKFKSLNACMQILRTNLKPSAQANGRWQEVHGMGIMN